MAQSYIGTLEVPSLIVTESKPLDVRVVVNNVSDLTNGSIGNLYTGIVVNVKGTADLYILTGSPRQASQLSSWSKVADGYLKSEDLEGYARLEDLVDFLTSSDVEDYIKAEDLENYIPKSELEDLASKSDLEGFVRTEDVLDFLTGSDLDDYARLQDIPTEGEFPSGVDIEDVTAVEDGYASVQGVMDYVNALLEKKNSLRYAYITGYPLNGTATDITKFNKYLLNATGTTEIEIMAAQEMAVWDPSTNDDLPSIKLTVDIPDDYELSAVYIWSSISNEYQLLENSNAFGTNPRYSTRDINGITYDSYVRGPVNDLGTRGSQRYKIVISKSSVGE